MGKLASRSQRLPAGDPGLARGCGAGFLLHRDVPGLGRVDARSRSRLQATDEEISSSVGAYLGRVLGSGRYPRFFETVTAADRLDPQGEMQVSVELILDGAAARIEAARKHGAPRGRADPGLSRRRGGRRGNPAAGR